MISGNKRGHDFVLITQALKLLMIAAVSTCFWTSIARAQLIANGSFEDVKFTPPASNIVVLPLGDTSITGWTIINDSIAWARSPNAFGIEPAPGNGVASLDLTGFTDNFPHGGVMQTITTVPGTRYTLSFDLGTFESNPALSGPVTVISSGGTAVQWHTFDPQGSGNQWGSFEMDFIALSEITTVRISGLSGIAYIGLDNVSVEESKSKDPMPELVYQNDFEVSAGSEWSDSSLSTTPGTFVHPADQFLGRFGSGEGFNPTVQLNLDDLGPHTEVSLACDLYIIYSWDGNEDQSPFGPDRFTISEGADGTSTVLLDTTFSNVTSPPFGIPFLQDYPDPYLMGNNTQFYGSIESRTLGYGQLGFNVDSVYRLNITIPHTDSTLSLHFSANTVVPLGGGVDSESFGLDNVVVTTNFDLPILLGDVNLDGMVNLLDVGPFVDLLLSGGFLPQADINGDGFVNLLDVNGFVDILLGGG